MINYEKISYPTSWSDANKIIGIFEQKFNDIIKAPGLKKKKIFLNLLYSNALDIHHQSKLKISDAKKDLEEAKKNYNPIKMALAYQRVLMHEKTANLIAKWMKMHHIRFGK